MRKNKIAVIISFVFSLLLIFSINFTNPQIAMADVCCPGDCDQYNVCVGAPPNCPAEGQGSCQQRGCFPGIVCNYPDVCVGDNCIPPPAGPGKCFPAGTKITLQDKSTKNIENIVPGDRVLSQNEAGKQSVSTVQSLLKPVSNNLCEIKYTNGDDLRVTKGHPLFTNAGWKAIDPVEAAKEDPGVPVSRLLIGDLMSKVDGTWPQVASISCKNETVQTYNLTVDDTHTYFAGGFLAHNKTICDSCGVVYPIITSITGSSTGFQINWTNYMGGGNQACITNDRYTNIVYIGSNYNAVNNNCNNAGSAHTYRGVGSVIPPGCVYVSDPTVIHGTGSTSFNTNDVGSTGLTIQPNTTYYIKVRIIVATNDDGGECAADKNSYLNSCSLSPGSATLTLNGASQTFTTHAYTPQSTYIPPEPSVSGITYAPICVSNCGGSGTPSYLDAWKITGTRFGYSGDKIRVVIVHNGVVYANGFYPVSKDSPTTSAYMVITSDQMAVHPTFTNFAKSDITTFTYPVPPYPWPQTITNNNGTVTIQGQYLGVNGKRVHVKISGYPTNSVTHRTLEGNYVVNNNQIQITLPASWSCTFWACMNSPYYYAITYTNSPDYPSNVPSVDLTITNKIDHVSYSQVNPTPSPTYINIVPSANTYTADVTGIKITQPSVDLRAAVYVKDSPPNPAYCKANIVVGGPTPTPNANAWWQVKDSDVQSNSFLNSSVPTGNYFDEAPVGGFPGVPASVQVANFSPGAVSAPTWGWQTQSGWTPKVFDYAYFANQIPSDTILNNVTPDGTPVSSTASPDGYTWYKYDGTDPANGGQDLNLQPSDFTGRKDILLVNSANLNITGNIIVPKGQGFFMAIVGQAADGTKGTINVSSTVTDIQGLYVADNFFNDTENSLVSATPLHVRGTVAAYAGINMLRDLGAANNPTQASDLFEYAPDQIMLYPSVLATRKINWKEVAP